MPSIFIRNKHEYTVPHMYGNALLHLNKTINSNAKLNDTSSLFGYKSLTYDVRLIARVVIFYFALDHLPSFAQDKLEKRLAMVMMTMLKITAFMFKWIKKS